MLERRRKELQLVRQRYGDLTIDVNLAWFVVEKIPLPTGIYDRPETRLLVLIPAAYPQTAPDNFYVSAGLRMASGSPPTNFSEGFQHSSGIWGTFSWHAQQWEPGLDFDSGHNLLTFMSSIEMRLAQGA